MEKGESKPSRYMIFNSERKAYVSVLFINTPWLWIHYNQVKENAIIYLEKELKDVEKILTEKKINYSLNKIQNDGQTTE